MFARPGSQSTHFPKELYLLILCYCVLSQRAPTPHDVNCSINYDVKCPLGCAQGAIIGPLFAYGTPVPILG